MQFALLRTMATWSMAESVCGLEQAIVNAWISKQDGTRIIRVLAERVEAVQPTEFLRFLDGLSG
jgi:hypothetical protein